jgi:hypothetical protein
VSPVDCITLNIGAGQLELQAWANSKKLDLYLSVPMPHQEQLLQALLRLGESPDWRAAAKRAHLSVCVSARWLGHTELPWSLSWLSKQREQVAARQYLEAAGYDCHPEDLIAVDDAPWGDTRLVVQWPAAVTSAIRTLVGTWRPRSVQISSAAVLAWIDSSSPDAEHVPPVVVQERVGQDLLLTLIRGGGVRPQEVLVRPCPRLDGSLGAGQAVGADESDRTDAERIRGLPDVAQVATGIARRAGWISEANKNDQSGAWSPLTLELSGAVPPRSALATDLPVPTHRFVWRDELRHKTSWAIAALLLFSVIALLSSARLHDLAQSAQLALQRQSAIPNASQPFVPGRELEQKILAVNAAINDLNAPLTDLMRALVPPKDIAVGVLGIELVDGSSPAAPRRVKLLAESPSPADMTRYVAFLSGRRPFDAATLVRHEVADEGAQSASESYRFTVELQWPR